MDFDFQKGTVTLNCTVGTDDEMVMVREAQTMGNIVDGDVIETTGEKIEYGTRTYELSNYVKGLGIYKLKSNEILINVAKKDEKQLVTEDFLSISLYDEDNPIMYTRFYGSYHNPNLFRG